MVNNEEINRKEFLKIIKENPQISITEITAKMKISRSTVRGIINFFKGAGKLEERSVGMAKLYTIK